MGDHQRFEQSGERVGCWASGKQRYAPLLHTDYVRNVALSDDGSLLGTVTADGFSQVGTLKRGGRCANHLHTRWSCNTACFSSDNRLLMT